MESKYKIVLIFTLILTILFLVGCDDAQVASQNLVKTADNFEVYRRIVFFNGITDNYLLEVEGKCAIFSGRTVNSELEVICKTGDEQYKKHYFGLSDNTAYFVEQIDSVGVNAYHYNVYFHRVTFKPQIIIPDVDLRVDITDLPSKQK